MRRVVRWMAAVGVTVLAVPVVAALGVSTASACSCATIDPLDAVGMAEVVFTGSVVSGEGSDTEPRWTFEVDGVVKGDVSPVEVVTGDDWAVGCGTDFGRFDEPVVVYAASSGERLRALGCMPTPSAESFAALLTAVGEPSGTGPPSAVMAGTYGLSDLAVLDGNGRTIARTNLGLDVAAVAHCQGSTHAAVVSLNSAPQVSIVDLASFSILEQRPLRSGFITVTGDRLECLDGGRLVVAAAGYGPDNGSVAIAVSSADETTSDELHRVFDNISRAVIHSAESVFLLPTAIGDPIRVLSTEDLELTGAEAAVPDGASTLDGDVSPDGSKLAVLATLSGRPAKWGTGATHVLTFDLVDAVPVAGSVEVVPLTEPGEDIESPNGAAKWIRWVDDETWIIESETVNTKTVEFVSVDGTQMLPPTDVGWGWGLVPLDAGVLRARNGGLEIIARDGTATDGDPAPSNSYVDRTLALDQLVDTPEFEAPTNTIEPLTIAPVASVEEVGQPSDEPEQAAAPTPDPLPPDNEASVAEPGASATSTTEAEGNTVLWLFVAGGLLLATMLVIGRGLRRRHADASQVGQAPPIQ